MALRGGEIGLIVIILRWVRENDTDIWVTAFHRQYSLTNDLYVVKPFKCV